MAAWSHFPQVMLPWLPCLTKNRQKLASFREIVSSPSPRLATSLEWPRCPIKSRAVERLVHLHGKFLRCIHSSDSHYGCYHWSKWGQIKLLTNHHMNVSRLFKINGCIAIWPMFVAEYFPRFWGTAKNFPQVQSVRVHLCDCLTQNFSCLVIAVQWP